MEYTVQITVKLCAPSVDYAHHIIKRALANAKLAEIVYLDSEVLTSESEEDYSEDEMRASPLWEELKRQ